MKRLLLLLVLLPCFVSAQNNKPIGDFYLQNYTIVYHHVFKDSLDSASAIAYKIMSSVSIRPGIKNMVQSGWIITGNYDDLNKVTFSKSEIKFDFVIEIRQGRYMVTILNLKQLQGAGLFGTAPAQFVPFDYTYARDDKVEWTSDAHDDLGVLDKCFTELFTIYLTAGIGGW